MRRFMAAVLCLSLSPAVLAKSFGLIGDTFAIAETSFLDFITTRLKALEQNGGLEAMQTHWQEQAALHAERPKALALYRATRTTSHYYKPELTLSQTIVDHQGRMLYPAGTKVNALERLPQYTPCWLFFNADDSAQVKWATNQLSLCENPKIILTGGSVKEAEEALQAVIYFDQEGRLTQKLGIHCVPARVTREDSALLVKEMAIKENGHEI